MTTSSNFRDHRIYLTHLVRVLLERGPAEPAEIYDDVADRAGITAEERLVEGSRERGNPVYRNRIQFARQALIDARLLYGSADPEWRRGMWELNAEGKALCRSLPPAELEATVRQRAADGARRRASARRESRALAGLDEAAENSGSQEELDEPAADAPDEDEEIDHLFEIEDLVEAANAEAKTTMLDYVRSMNETAFEHLVGDVLKAALRAESVRITQQSRDGGIDGLLYFDALQIRIAVFEAKRYADGSVVGRGLIDAFATAARRRRASHSIFVTSSRFSKEAQDAAKDEAIRLIDGVAFVELMSEHGIGLRARRRFVVYEVDPAWTIDSEGSAE